MPFGQKDLHGGELFRQREQELVSALTPGVLVTGDPSCWAGRWGTCSLTLPSTPPGARIRVWCGFRDGRPALTVENTGARIPEEALPHLFEAFYREEGSRSRSTGGSGLGLYLVRMILERHGASCAIQNTAEGVRAAVRFGPSDGTGIPAEMW